MDTSGKPYEGWMTVIPVSVFLFVVVTVGLARPDLVAALDDPLAGPSDPPVLLEHPENVS